MIQRPNIEVISRNFDNSARKKWTAELVTVAPPLIELVGTFTEQLEHSELGLIRAGTLSTEYYWLDRWYNIFRFDDPSGEFLFFYCNICLPPTFADAVLDYVDLDIDVIVKPQNGVLILDREEFDQNCVRYGVPDETRQGAFGALDELLALIERRDFPFSSRT